MLHFSSFSFSIVVALVVLLSCLGGCDEPEQAPAYLHIDTVLLNTAVGQGTASHALKTVWLSLDGQSLGAYELPVTVPILAEGTQTILVEGGIAVSGVLSNRLRYPFVAPRSYTVNLAPLQTAQISPELSYQSDVVFEMMSDFEASSNFAFLVGSEAQLSLTDDPTLVFEGGRSLAIVNSIAAPTFTLATVDAYGLPVANVPVYIEMNYRCDAPFLVGLRGIDGNGGAQSADLVVRVNAKPTWNKIYIDVEPIISSLTPAYNFFQVTINATLPDSLAQATYLFDNIKLLHQ